MRLVKPSIEVLPIGVDIFKRIETIGRVCVRSEDKITDESAMKFCRDRLKSGHTAIFNHGIRYFSVSRSVNPIYLYRLIAEYPHIKITTDKTGGIFIAVPYRCYLDWESMIKPIELVYNDTKDNSSYNSILRYLFERPAFNSLTSNIKYNVYLDFQTISEAEAFERCPDIVHVSVKFTTDRGITHELVRHTIAAFMQESTRWCNYTGDKFDNEITCIEPFWLDAQSDKLMNDVFNGIEESYLCLIQDCGWTAQQARSVLPNALKSDIWITATLKEWYGATIQCTVGDISYEERKGFIPQRTHKSAHPKMIEIMNIVKIELDKLGYGNWR